MAHLKKLVAPKSWSLDKRKDKKFVARPMPGPHKLKESITLSQILISILRYAKNKKEAMSILNGKKALVNGKTRTELRFPVGLLDTLSIADEHYVIVYNSSKKFSLLPIDKAGADLIFCKIINKTILKGKKIQLNFHNGNNLIVKKDGYKVGDTLLIKNKEIKKHLKFVEGATVYITSGKYMGAMGKLEKMERTSELSKDLILIESGKDQILTRKDFAFVIEKEFEK